MESLNDVGSITYFNADGSIHETVTFNNQERYLEEAKEALKTRGITGWKCNTLSKDLNLHYELYKMIADEVDDDAMSRGEYARQHPELQKTEEIERTTQAAIRTDSKYQQAEQRRPKVSNLTNAIKEKISITEYAAMLGYHVKQISSDRYTLLEHDSMAIKFDKSGMEYFIWNSRGIGGSVIDFAMAIHDVDKETAIKTLRNYLHSRTPEQIDDTNRRKKIQAAHSMKPKSLEMPPPCEGAFRKVYAYLSKSRGIEAEIVSSLMKNRQLYQDERGNAVFVGFDYDGREKYAFKRSSNTNIPYRGEATGSNKSVGFSMGLVDRTPRRLFVTEAAIDALSLKSLILPDQQLKGISILRPITTELIKRENDWVAVRMATNEEREKIAKGELKIYEKTYFAISKVYDISQTDFPKDRYPEIYSMGQKSMDHAEVYACVKELARASGIPVKKEQLPSISLHGYYSPSENAITINSNLEDTKAAVTLCHEYAHGLLHRTSTQSEAICEFEAQSLALMLMARYGLPQDDSEIGYMKTYLERANNDKNFSLDTSLERLQKQLKFVDERISLIAEHRQTEFAQTRAQAREPGKGKQVSENFRVGL